MGACCVSGGREEVGKADEGCAAGEEGEGGCGMRRAVPARDNDEAKSGSRPSSSMWLDFSADGGSVDGSGWTCTGLAPDGIAVLASALAGGADLTAEETVLGYWRFAAPAAREATLED